jgi:hypothetical protein
LNASCSCCCFTSGWVYMPMGSAIELLERRSRWLVNTRLTVWALGGDPDASLPGGELPSGASLPMDDRRLLRLCENPLVGEGSSGYRYEVGGVW